MAKKSVTKTKQPKQPAVKKAKAEETVPVSKQTVGGVTGAILGAAVAGPFGAIAGGLTGAIVGDASAKGKKPMKRAVEAISAELHETHLGEKLRAVGERVTSKIKSLRKGMTKAASPKKAAPTAAAAPKKSKAKPAKKAVKAATKKAAATPKKRRAKKKR